MTQVPYEQIAARIQAILQSGRLQAPDVFGSRLTMEYLPMAEGAFRFASRTESWMCNPGGTVHGGICATLVDEAMGIVVFAMGDGKTISPTINLQVNYHRPLLPGKEITISIRPVSVTRRLITLSAEVSCAEKPESLCFSSTATFFCKDPA